MQEIFIVMFSSILNAHVQYFLLFMCNNGYLILFNPMFHFHTPENVRKPKGFGSLEAVIRRCSVKEGVLKKFTKSKGKHLWQKHLWQGLIKKETVAQVFSSEFCEIFKKTCFYRTPLVDASVSLCFSKWV